MRILNKAQKILLEKLLDKRAKILIERKPDSGIVFMNSTKSMSSDTLRIDMSFFQLDILHSKICALEGVSLPYNRDQKKEKIHDFYKDISPENYRKDMLGGLMGAEGHLFSLRNSKARGLFPGSDAEFRLRVNRARVEIKEYIRRAGFAKKFIGKGVTAYDIRMAGG